jgi:hypothetical protein
VAFATTERYPRYVDSNGIKRTEDGDQREVSVFRNEALPLKTASYFGDAPYETKQAAQRMLRQYCSSERRAE